jgi:hypothetical protein
MNPWDIISPVATQPANDSYRTGPSLTKRTYVFIFVPLYVEKKSDTTMRPPAQGPLAKLRRLFFRQDRHLQPFWTSFIDNPRPESLK